MPAEDGLSAVIFRVSFYIAVLTFAMEQGGRAAAYLPYEPRETDGTYGSPLNLKRENHYRLTATLRGSHLSPRGARLATLDSPGAVNAIVVIDARRPVVQARSGR